MTECKMENIYQTGIDAARLAVFLEQARPLWPQPIKAKPIEIDAEKFEQFLDKLRTPLQAVREAGLRINPWVVAGLERREVANTAVLAHLWTYEQGGTLARNFLAAFLEGCKAKSVGCMAVYPKGFDSWEAALAAGYTIYKEHPPLGEITERLDILIEGTNFLIAVEVKIDAVETQNAEGVPQTKRYKDVLAMRGEKTGREHCAVILLSCFKTTTDADFSATWGDVVKAAQAVATPPQPSHNQQLILQFAQHISTF
jgi:PD-(D/E)XK nuclease superfamily